MTDENYELYRTLGELQAGQTAMANDITGLTAIVQSLDKKLGVVPLIEQRVDNMEPHVEDWKRTKQRGIGILGLASVGGGAVAAFAKSILVSVGFVAK